MNAQKTQLATVMDFHGSFIAFKEINGKMMINATQMAKPFNKRPYDWLITQQAKDLTKTFSVTRNLVTADFKVVKQGGSPLEQGTWLHEELALVFAQWLSPEFYLACNLKLKELLTQGIPNLEPKYGVQPILYLNKKIYPYIEAMRVMGGSVKSSASSRKKRAPEQFTKVFGRNFVTEAYLDLLNSYYSYKNAQKKLANQLKLEL